jgi:hypothetical protein
MFRKSWTVSLSWYLLEDANGKTSAHSQLLKIVFRMRSGSCTILAGIFYDAEVKERLRFDWLNHNELRAPQLSFLLQRLLLFLGEKGWRRPLREANGTAVMFCPGAVYGYKGLSPL